ncbi:MAG: S41 family peptidase [Planctomycetota bacterium]
MPRRNSGILLVAMLIGAFCAARVERNPYARHAAEAYALVEERALEDPPDEELFAGAVRGMVSVLRRRGDTHSDYLDPRAAEPLRAEMRQEFGGVGVRVGVEGEPPRVVVVEPPVPGTPAYASPIRARDTIVAVDGRPTAGLGLRDVVAMMRGGVGEPLELTVRHEGDDPEDADALETFRLVREVIRVPSIVGDRRTPAGDWLFPLEEDARIALVRLTTFGNRTAEELRETLTRLTGEGVEAVTLDVRGNGGGALDAAIDVCELFLPDGAPIVSTRGRDGHVLARYDAEGDGPFVGLPIVVLIDGDTASASEIVAAALRDDDRAEVAGERSFGKGTVQQLLPLESGRSLLKLTSASYWRPSGENIHRRPGAAESEAWGVSPDAGLATPLTDAEREAWWRWRRERDLLVGPSDADSAGEVSLGDGPLERDAALRAAVERLRERLDGAA